MLHQLWRNKNINKLIKNIISVTAADFTCSAFIMWGSGPVYLLKFGVFRSNLYFHDWRININKSGGFWKIALVMNLQNHARRICSENYISVTMPGTDRHRQPAISINPFPHPLLVLSCLRPVGRWRCKSERRRSALFYPRFTHKHVEAFKNGLTLDGV